MPEKLLNLIRISDSFFPMGSFTISQGMEQLVGEKLLPKDKLTNVLRAYMERIWKSFDFQIFSHSLEAAEHNDLEMLTKLDDVCYASKISEENRSSMVKMGINLLNAMNFKKGTLGASYKELAQQEKVHASYPVILAIASRSMGLDQRGGISLIYVNLIEVVASLVRMAEIDYIEAQALLTEAMKDIELKIGQLSDLNQSFPLVDIASMRHESNPNRMFIS